MHRLWIMSHACVYVCLLCVYRTTAKSFRCAIVHRTDSVHCSRVALCPSTVLFCKVPSRATPCGAHGNHDVKSNSCSTEKWCIYCHTYTRSSHLSYVYVFIRTGETFRFFIRSRFPPETSGRYILKRHKKIGNVVWWSAASAHEKSKTSSVVIPPVALGTPTIPNAAHEQGTRGVCVLVCMRVCVSSFCTCIEEHVVYHPP